MADHVFTQRARRLPRGTLPRVLAVFVLATIVVVIASLIAWTARTPDRVKGDGKDYGLPTARVTMDVRPDGTVDVVEQITFDFRGSFSGAFRDIPMRRGDRIEGVVVCEAGVIAGTSTSLAAQLAQPQPPDVSHLDEATAQRVLEAFYRSFPDARPDPRAAAAGGEDGDDQARCPAGLTAYGPGANTTLGSYDTPGTYGTEVLANPRGDDEAIPSVQRVVWHHDAYDQLRDFTIAYRAHGWLRRTEDGELALEVKPWGAEWKSALGTLGVTIRLPAASQLDADDVELVASSRGAGRVTGGVREAAGRGAPVIGIAAGDLTSGERVDVTALIPSEGSAINASGLPKRERTSDEVLASAREEAQRNTRARSWLATLTDPSTTWWIIIAAFLGLLVVAACAWQAYRRTLREEPWPADVPALISDPPGELPPALAASLVEQRSDVSPHALVATVFDLVRRDAWLTLPAQGEERGAKVDIELRQPESRDGLELEPYEQHALKLVDRIIGKRGAAMGEFKGKLKKSRSMSLEVTNQEGKFEKAVKERLKQLHWYEKPRSRWLTWPAWIAVLAIAVGIVLAAWDGLGWAVGLDPRVTALAGAILIAFGGAMFTTLLVVFTARLFVTRYRPEVRREAAQWTAYRDFLDSYGDMADEQTASIELWERHLVYAIAFGCADDILNAVRPQGAEAGASGVGSSRLGALDSGMFHGFSSGLAARAPQPSSSSGGGGGSSSFGGGGGGFGGGGGGGGAW